MAIQDTTPINPISYIRVFLKLAKEYGVSTSVLLEAADIDQCSLKKPDVYITFGQYKKLVVKAAELIDDPAFHLKYGRSINITKHGKRCYSAFTTSCFENALRNTITYIKALNRLYLIDVMCTENTATISLDTVISAPELYVGEIEHLMAPLFLAFKHLPNRDSNIYSVNFKYPKPSHTTAYDSLFGEICKFECSKNSISFATKQLKKYWVEGEPMLSVISKTQALDSAAV